MPEKRNPVPETLVLNSDPPKLLKSKPCPLDLNPYAPKPKPLPPTPQLTAESTPSFTSVHALKHAVPGCLVVNAEQRGM